MTFIQKTLTLFLFIYLGTNQPALHGQRENKNTYSQKELESFAQIFSESRMQQGSLDVTIISLLQEYNISYGRYKDILTSQIEGKDVGAYTENERKFFEAIKAENKALDEKIIAFERKRSEELGIPYTKYAEIKSKYLKSPTFQHEVYPIFQKMTEESGDK